MARCQNLLGNRLDAAVRILSEELRLDDRTQLRREVYRESERLAVTADLKTERTTVRIRLVNDGEGVIGVERAALVGGRNAEGDAH